MNTKTKNIRGSACPVCSGKEYVEENDPIDAAVIAVSKEKRKPKVRLVCFHCKRMRSVSKRWNGDSATFPPYVEDLRRQHEEYLKSVEENE